MARIEHIALWVSDLEAFGTSASEVCNHAGSFEHDRCLDRGIPLDVETATSALTITFAPTPSAGRLLP